MSRYVRAARKPRTWDIDEDEPFRPGIEVADHEPVETGLVWSDGEPVMRQPNPMGFGRNEEWA